MIATSPPCSTSDLCALADWAEVSREQFRRSIPSGATGSERARASNLAEMYDRLSDALSQVIVYIESEKGPHVIGREPHPILRDEIWSILVSQHDESINWTTDKIMEAVIAHEKQVSA
jgi:hypothetical protein